MNKPVRSLACLLAGAVVCSTAVAAQAQPVVLTEVEMDDATAAGVRADVAARLAALKSRLADRREELRERLANLRNNNGSKSHSSSWTSSDGTTTVRVVSNFSYSSRND